MSKDWLSNDRKINFEDFDEPTISTSGSMVNVVEVDHNKYDEDSCMDRFVKGMRCFWATKQTEDLKDNRELLIKTTLRELVVYIVYLVVLVIITFGSTNGLSFYFTNTLNNLFLNAPFTGGSGSYAQAASIGDYWNFVQGPLQTGLYWSQWYNNMALPPSEINLIYYENKLVGVPRMRQVRVRNNSCNVPDTFKTTILTCYATFNPSTESTDTFGLGNSTAWTYTSEGNLNGRASAGLLGSYGGGGFYVDLGQTQADTANTMAFLFNNLWIDRATRAVILDFTVYNANINLFCVIKLVTEFPSTGGIIPNFEFRTVKLLRYVSPMDYCVLASELIFLVYILYYIIEEFIEIRKHKLAYFSGFWNCLDVIVIGISILAISFNIYRTILVQNLLQNLLLLPPDQYPNFDYISSWQINFNYAVAFTLFFSWVKLFKYITFNKTMCQMSVTLGRCAKDLAGFAIMFFVVFLAFAQLGYLLFSSSCVNFRGFSDSIFALFRLILGDFNFQEFQQANSLFGPLYFLLYVFFVFFVLFNMFLAIINDTYSEVKDELNQQKNEFEMGDYFKQRANFIISKLNIKKEKIIDIQDAMGMADVDGDDKIDFAEWKEELKKRGYADEEIENVFAQYDIDGDRVLDKAERLQMQEELENQKKSLNTKIQKTEGEAKKVVRNNDSESGVNMEEYHLLITRVDQMEATINGVVDKLDGVLKNIGKIEKSKSKRSETMGLILDTLTSSDSLSEDEKRKKIEDLVNDEISKMKRESVSTSSKSSNKSNSESHG